MSTEELLFLGIDTSNYTTSAAVCSESGEIICNIKIPLPVRAGERGLRQSDAVFEHVKALPAVSEKLRGVLHDYRPDGYFRIVAVGCSAFPRDAVGSYMPCFLSGQAAASVAAAALGCPLYQFSHQRGHIAAALYSAGACNLVSERFAAFHVSGGTTEILLVRPDAEFIFSPHKIGGTLDINAGQAIDRCGVAMGLRFPAGAEMERLAVGYSGKIPKMKLCVNGTECNLSGVENKAGELYANTGDKAAVSAFVIDFAARTLEKMTDNLISEYGKLPILYAGGVMSCSLIKRKLEKYGGLFAEPSYSSDNAAGTAWLTRRKYMQELKRTEI